MDVEREKRDKLASARRKLNEYKLNRSSGKPAPPAGSSKPADVPLFYQNINNTPSAYNIFNPAAIDNNNDSSATPNIFYTSSSVAEPVAQTIPVSTTNQNFGVPVSSPNSNSEQNLQSSGITTEEETVLIDPINVFQQNLPLSSPVNVSSEQVAPVPSQTGMSTPSSFMNLVDSTDHAQAPSNPFVTPLAASSEFILEGQPSLFTAFSSDKENSDSDQPVFNAPTAILEPEPLHQTLVAASNSSCTTNSETILADLHPAKTQLISDEYIPSAPPIDATLEEANKETLNLKISTDKEVKIEDSVEIVKADIVSHILSKEVDTEMQQVPAESSIIAGVNENMFASSLFGASTGGKVVEHVFNVSGGRPLEVVSTATKEASNSLIFNPLTANTAPVFEGLDPELPVFEFVDKDNIQSLVSEENVQGGGESYGKAITENTEILPSTFKSPGLGVHESVASPLNLQTLPDISLRSEIQHNIHERDAHTVSEGEDKTRQEDPNLVEQLHQSEAMQAIVNSSNEAMLQMKSVQEALELQIEELRRENTYLLNRQTELTLKIEDSERLAHEFKLEKDRVKEELLTTSQAFRAKINSLCEENQRIVKNSTEVGVDLRAKLEEKSRQLEEMQKAAIILSQSKMDLASRLDHEGERVKELEKAWRVRDETINHLNEANKELQNKLKQEQQKDAVIHQLQDQARHYQVQTETLQRQLEVLSQKLKASSPSIHPPAGTHHHSEPAVEKNQALMAETTPDNHDPESEKDQNASKKSETDTHCHTGPCDHDHSEHDHHHLHSKQEEHHHHSGHEHHHHSGHEHDHHHHGEDHHHENEHEHSHGLDVVARRGPSDEVTELKKTLHRLQWENSTFRNELDVLAVDAKQKKSYEEKCATLADENRVLKEKVEQLEHVIIQLQGENDTIGDYITLYQSQRLALKECAKEKDAQLEYLAKEREMLIHRLAELTALVNELKESKSEAGSQCADDHMHSTLDLPQSEGKLPQKRQIEGKIRDLLTEISSSTLMENFHPCAVCSGRLMTV